MDKEREKENRRKAERQNGFRNFYQINRKYSYVVDMLFEKNPTAARLLWFLMNHMEKNNTLFATASTLSECLNLSESTISRCKKYLEKMGIIEVQRCGVANMYIVNPNLVWGNWSSKRKECPFEGTIPLPPEPEENIIKKDAKTRILSVTKRKKTV